MRIEAKFLMWFTWNGIILVSAFLWKRSEVFPNVYRACQLPITILNAWDTQPKQGRLTAGSGAFGLRLGQHIVAEVLERGNQSPHCQGATNQRGGEQGPGSPLKSLNLVIMLRRILRTLVRVELWDLVQPQRPVLTSLWHWGFNLMWVLKGTHSFKPQQPSTSLHISFHCPHYSSWLLHDLNTHAEFSSRRCAHCVCADEVEWLHPI